jgi:hypothetical protein
MVAGWATEPNVDGQLQGVKEQQQQQQQLGAVRQ